MTGMARPLIALLAITAAITIGLLALGMARDDTWADYDAGDVS